MRYGVLGTGGVGRTLASKLIEVGHEVTMGSRAAGNENAVAWVDDAGGNAREGSFADAAEFGDAVVNATAGVASLEALAAAGAENLAGKLLIDVANPLDFSQGMPPTLAVCNDDSLGEQIQRASSGRPSGQDAQHDELGRDGRAHPRPRRAQRLRRRRRRRRQDGGQEDCSKASVGRLDRSSTSAASTRRAEPRCSYRCGCASTAWPEAAT